MKTEAMLVTPTMAATFLSGNTDNRKVRKSHVKWLAEIMRKGEWVMTHQGIAITESGRLVDGQHRLMAVIESGMPCVMQVTTGAKEHIFKALDNGITRSVADLTKIDKKLIETAKLAYTFAFSTTAKPLVADIEYIAGYLKDDHEELMAACNRNSRIFSATPFRVGAICMMRADKDNIDYVKDIYRALVLSKIGSLPPAGQALVSHCLRMGIASQGGSSARSDTLARALCVFDKSKQGLSKIQISSLDKYRDNVLQHCIPRNFLA